MRIERGTPGDAEAIAEMHTASWKEAYRGIVAAPILEAIDASARTERWRQKLVANEFPILVAKEGDVVAGFAHVMRSRDDDAGSETGEVAAIYLHREHWKRGIGRALLERGTGELAALGFTVATLWVLEANENARGFYEHMGFVVDGGRKVDPWTTLQELRYRKQLRRT